MAYERRSKVGLRTDRAAAMAYPSPSCAERILPMPCTHHARVSRLMLSTVRRALIACLAAALWPAQASAQGADDLLAKHAALGNRLLLNQFQRPVVLESTETLNHVRGDVYAVIDYPYSVVSAELNNPDHWCDVMSLHINTKYCRATQVSGTTVLNVNIGKKTPEDLANAVRVYFNYTAHSVTPQYFDIRLSAKDGPMGTSDYRITLEAVPLENAKTFLHLTYTYATSFSAKVAMRAYLATIGADKVGFTPIAKAGAGVGQFIGGLRGLVERNTMRYYLAIDSYLESTNEVPAKQLDKRLNRWFSAVERYPRQLHEMNRDEYIAMKRSEYLRQKTAN